MSNTIKYSKTNFKDLFGKGSDVQVCKNVDALADIPWRLMGSGTTSFSKVYECERYEEVDGVGELPMTYIKVDLGATPIILRVTP